jgi:hypothetical protein
MMKIEGSGSASGSISQRHGYADPDPHPDRHQNVMDPQHCFLGNIFNKYPTIAIVCIFLYEFSVPQR